MISLFFLIFYLLLFFVWIFFGRIDAKGFVTGFGSVDWKKTHEAAAKTAVVVTALLKNGATCVGKTIMDELGFGYLFLFLLRFCFFSFPPNFCVI